MTCMLRSRVSLMALMTLTTSFGIASTTLWFNVYTTVVEEFRRGPVLSVYLLVIHMTLGVSTQIYR